MLFPPPEILPQELCKPGSLLALRSQSSPLLRVALLNHPNGVTGPLPHEPFPVTPALLPFPEAFMFVRLLWSQLSPQCPEQTLVIDACSPLPEHLPRGLKGQLCSLSALSNVTVPSLCLSSLLCKVGRTIDTPSEETTYLRHTEHMELGSHRRPICVSRYSIVLPPQGPHEVFGRELGAVVTCVGLSSTQTPARTVASWPCDPVQGISLFRSCSSLENEAHWSTTSLPGSPSWMRTRRRTQLCAGVMNSGR